MMDSQNKVIVVDDKSSLSGTGEVVGPYLDMVCMSQGGSYNEPCVFFIVDPANKQFKGIIKIEYNKDNHQKYLYFSGFDGLSENSLHKIIKDINNTCYDFNVFKIKSNGSEIMGTKQLATTIYLGVSYIKYQQLLASDEQGQPLLYFEEPVPDDALIG